MKTLQPSQTVSEWWICRFATWELGQKPLGAFLLIAFLVHLVHFFGHFWYLGTGSKASRHPSRCIFATCQWSIKGFITRSIQPHLLYYLLLQALICSSRAHKGPSNFDFFHFVCCWLLFNIISFCGWISSLLWFWEMNVKLRPVFFSDAFFSKGQEEMLAHQVCMVFIWKVFKSQNKISIYSPNPDFLSPHSDCLEENFLRQECNFVNLKCTMYDWLWWWKISASTGTFWHRRSASQTTWHNPYLWTQILAQPDDFFPCWHNADTTFTF